MPIKIASIREVARIDCESAQLFCIRGRSFMHLTGVQSRSINSGDIFQLRGKSPIASATFNPYDDAELVSACGKTVPLTGSEQKQSPPILRHTVVGRVQDTVVSQDAIGTVRLKRFDDFFQKFLMSD